MCIDSVFDDDVVVEQNNTTAWKSSYSATSVALELDENAHKVSMGTRVFEVLFHLWYSHKNGFTYTLCVSVSRWMGYLMLRVRKSKCINALAR
jgi:hypothetical protein